MLKLHNEWWSEAAVGEATDTDAADGEATDTDANHITSSLLIVIIVVFLQWLFVEFIFIKIF